MKKRILIIEDEEGIANAFMKQLTLIGNFDVQIAAGGAEGLKLLEDGKFDLVLLDLVMPEMDGVEVLQNMKDQHEKYKDVPVIALTNVTSDETRDEVMKLGAKKFIVKTNIEPDDLIGQINEVIGK
ncbi:response regulator [Candidatus Dojkabacteria bacterium]|nr:response regulator [Candidatus Dojkabacteria bacterium]